MTTLELRLSMIERKLNTSCQWLIPILYQRQQFSVVAETDLSSDKTSIKTKQRIVFQTLSFLRNLGFIAFSSSNWWFLNILCCLGNGHLYCTVHTILFLTVQKLIGQMMTYPWSVGGVLLPCIHRIGNRLVFLLHTLYLCRVDVVATSELFSQYCSWSPMWELVLIYCYSYLRLSTAIHFLLLHYSLTLTWCTYSTVLHVLSFVKFYFI
jgi:hypothetical protein